MRWFDAVRVVGSVALVLGCRGATPDETRPQAPSVTRYRFATATATATATVTDDTLAIRELETRVLDPAASPFDMSDLAELYLRRAQRDGDAEDYARSEA